MKAASGILTVSQAFYLRTKRLIALLAGIRDEILFPLEGNLLILIG